MKSFVGRDGIDSYVVKDADGRPLEVDIKLNSETRDLLNFVKDLKNASGMYDGYQLGLELNTIVSLLTMIHYEWEDEQEVRNRVPAVQNAWDSYKMLLNIVKQNKEP